MGSEETRKNSFSVFGRPRSSFPCDGREYEKVRLRKANFLSVHAVDPVGVTSGLTVMQRSFAVVIKSFDFNAKKLDTTLFSESIANF